MDGSVNRRLSFVILGICATLATSGSLKAGFAASAAEMSTREGQDSPPRPVEPPHKPAQQGTRFALLFGLNLFTYGQYGYNTAITMPDGRTLHYAGQQNASGGTFFTGAAITPPAALRRLTVGFTLNLGGLQSWTHPVIPSGVVTPFSQSNLSLQIQRNEALSSAWRPAVSPYIEHELGFLLKSRIRAGYQYWHQLGSSQGLFPVDQSRSALADYNVQFLHSSHLIRLSLNNYTSLEDDTDTNSASQKRNPSFVRQAGLLIGTNNTVMVFIGLGPAWSF
jgi:hypothetical protein